MCILSDKEKSQSDNYDGLKNCESCNNTKFFGDMIYIDGMHLCDLECLAAAYQISMEVIETIKNYNGE